MKPPASDTRPERLGLALSGGGFRACAFHLGVLKRLFELGILQQLTTISAVSGGSIVAAFFLSWQTNKRPILSPADWDEFETDLTEVMRHGIRGKVFWDVIVHPALLVLLPGILYGYYRWSSGLLTDLLPASPIVALLLLLAFVYWYQCSSDRLAVQYDKTLYKDLHIRKLPGAPTLIINATSLGRGELLQITSTDGRHSKTEMFPGSKELAGASVQTNQDVDAFLSRAVAASSAVPGLFRPVRLASFRHRVHRITRLVGDTEYPERVDDAVDGGIFDNQGLFALIDSESHRCDKIIVSDAAKVLEVSSRKGLWWIGVLQRSQDILLERVRNQSYQWLKRTEIPKVVVNITQQDGSALPEPVTQHLPRVRTDMDRFSRYEIWALMKHGYHLIDARLAQEPAFAILATTAAESNFQTANNNIRVPPAEVRRLPNHLKYSSQRVLCWRWLQRVPGSVLRNRGRDSQLDNPKDRPNQPPAVSLEGRAPTINTPSFKEQTATPSREREAANEPRPSAEGRTAMTTEAAAAGLVRPYRSPVEYGYVLVLALIFLAIGWIGLDARPEDRSDAWFKIVILLAAFAVIVGRGITGVWRGILIDSRYKMSLGRFQLLAWSLVVLSALVTAVLSNVTLGLESPLEIDIPSTLWVLMGISTASAVGGSAVLASKKPIKPDKEEVKEVEEDPQREASAPIKRDSIVVQNTSIKDARWADLLKGDETGNATAVDLGKIQMLFFTFILVVGYGAAIARLFGAEGPILGLPPVDEGMNVLLGISHTGYVAAKSVTQSATTGAGNQNANGRNKDSETAEPITRKNNGVNP